MQAPATAEQTWTPVRCPCNRSVLVDVRGGGPGEIRRFCRRCRGWWVVTLATRRVRCDDTAHARATS